MPEVHTGKPAARRDNSKTPLDIHDDAQRPSVDLVAVAAVLEDLGCDVVGGPTHGPGERAANKDVKRQSGTLCEFRQATLVGTQGG